MDNMMPGMGGPGGPDGGPGGPPGFDRGGYKENKGPSDWVVTESVTFADGLTIEEGKLPIAPEGKGLLMTVDGVVRDIQPGTYPGKVELNLFNPITIDASRTQMSAGTYRTALMVVNGEVDREHSIPAAVQGGRFEKGLVSGVNVTAKSIDWFNGIIIDENGEDGFTLKDSTFKLNGSGNSEGAGAAITIFGKGKNILLDNVTVWSLGTTSCIIAAGNIEAEVKNSVIYAQREPGSAKMCPWVLGLNGNNRGTNAIENAHITYHDSIVVANSWSTLSTDSGRNVRLVGYDMFSGIGTLEEYDPARADQYNAAPECNGKKYGFILGDSAIGHSGYCNYADGFHNSFKNVEFWSPDYLFILSTGKATIDVEDSKMYAGRSLFMWHKNQGGSVNVKGGTWYSGGPAFQAKTYSESDPDGFYCYLNVDGADITLGGDKILYQLMTSDDAGLGTPGYTIRPQEGDWSLVQRLPDTYMTQKTIRTSPMSASPVYLVEGKEVMCPGDPAEFEKANPGAEKVMIEASYHQHDTYASFSNMTVEGSIYNACWERIQDLQVTLDNCRLTGAISSSVANHVDGAGKALPVGFLIDQNVTDAHLGIGRLKNVPAPSVNNELTLTLKGGSKWTVTQTSYLDRLTIEDGSSIQGKVTVDGAPVSGPGAYAGKIVVETA